MPSVFVSAGQTSPTFDKVLDLVPNHHRQNGPDFVARRSIPRKRRMIERGSLRAAGMTSL
jgi:hypothetical protein